jgi:ABC-2 type transport system permease protein
MARAYVAAAAGVLRRDAAIFASYRFGPLGRLASTAFSIVIFYYVSRLVRVQLFATPDAYFSFVVVGLVIFGVLTATLGVASATLRQELVAGTFERFVLSPFGAVGGIVSMMLFPCGYSLVLAAATIAIALPFGLDIQWTTAALAIPCALLGTLAFLPFSIVIAAATLVFKQAGAAAHFAVAGISVVAGLYFPVSLLPGWIEWTANVQPFTPAANLLRHELVGTAAAGNPWVDAAKLAGFALVLVPAALLLLRGAVGIARRRGTIVEY